jgi:hypothetical protein
MSPDSAAVQSLQSTADAAIPRANVYGSIPYRNAVLRVLYSIQDSDAVIADRIGNRNDAAKLFKWCKRAGYATVVMSKQARDCSLAGKALANIDDRWARYVNGTETKTFAFGITRQVARQIPFDGIVSNERSLYPGVARGSFADLPVVTGANHQNIYERRDGLFQIERAMLQVLQMERQAPPATVSLSGPTSFSSSATLTWNATASSGDGMYTYQWSYKPSGATAWSAMSSTGASASRSVSSSTPSFTVRVVVSSAGQTATTTLWVANTGGCVPQPGGPPSPQ